MPDYSTRHGKPIGASSKAMGGAALNLPVAVLEGESDMIYTFDDFNGIMDADSFSGTGIFEYSGWLLVDDGSAPTADTITMNDAATATGDFDSCIRIFPGTGDSSGGNMQLDHLTGAVSTENLSTHDFQHIWIPEDAGVPSRGAAGAGTVLDNTTWVFATRIGLNADETGTGTNWNGAMYIGWAAGNDTTIMDHDTGVITDAAGNLHGFHVGIDGSIRGISKRITGDSQVDGTNYTELFAAAAADNTVANGARVVNDTMWFDLAFRMDISDMSSDTANGSTRFFYRGPLNRVSPLNPGRDELAQPGEGYMPWREHSTTLLNETPNHSAALVPTIECLNGVTAGLDCCMYVDWWMMGRSRVSR
jgi:hypothetical protein